MMFSGGSKGNIGKKRVNTKKYYFSENKQDKNKKNVKSNHFIFLKKQRMSYHNSKKSQLYQYKQGNIFYRTKNSQIPTLHTCWITGSCHKNNEFTVHQNRIKNKPKPRTPKLLSSPPPLRGGEILI